MVRKSLYDYCTELGMDDLLHQWCAEKNGEITPNTISYGSKKKVLWQCKNGHQWQATVYSRTGGNSGCPHCANKKPNIIKYSNSLSSRHPSVAAQWHPTRNGDLKPENFAPRSHKKVWWYCENGHEWQATIHSRSNGRNCPICANRISLPGENDLATTNPDLAAQWHPTKNVDLTPRDVTAGSGKQVWWQCEKGHEWQVAISIRNRHSSGCPVCAGKVVIPGENDLASVFPAVANQWNHEKNGQLTPQRAFAFSNKKVWWRCDLGHEWQAAVSDRTRRGDGCPYCSGRKVLAGFNDLATIEPQVAAQWHPTLNNELTPEMVSAGSNKRVWWQCPEGHAWKAVIYSRTGKQKAGCPVCAGKINQARKQRYDSIMAENKPG